MTYLAVGALVITAASAIYGGVMANKADKAAAAQANARGAFSDYQDRLAGLQKMNQANQVMDQAKQQTTIIKDRALALRGSVVTAQGASGAVGTVGGAAHASEVVEKGAAADVSATFGSAINKNSALVEAGMNDNIDASNAITNGAAQAASLDAAGSAAETGSILSGVGSAMMGASKISGGGGTTPSGDGLTPVQTTAQYLDPNTGQPITSANVSSPIGE